MPVPVLLAAAVFMYNGGQFNINIMFVVVCFFFFVTNMMLVMTIGGMREIHEEQLEYLQSIGRVVYKMSTEYSVHPKPNVKSNESKPNKARVSPSTVVEDWDCRDNKINKE